MTMKRCRLFTMGYEGREIDEFIERLKQYGITRLIDVRDMPLSRKKGFSKSALQERLGQEGIVYIHIKALGCPPSIRNQVKSDGDYEWFFEAYSAYLSGHMEVIAEVRRYLSDGKACLMCYERSHEECHRSIVASRIREYFGKGVQIKHI
ncbi:MAG: DUF488 domain-containing protein [candidate division Zixibacteria bacterium]|nr:DUF488 domain-containing protein [candidate division Zixibacteria bacterium]